MREVDDGGVRGEFGPLGMKPAVLVVVAAGGGGGGGRKVWESGDAGRRRLKLLLREKVCPLGRYPLPPLENEADMEEELKSLDNVWLELLGRGVISNSSSSAMLTISMKLVEGESKELLGLARGGIAGDLVGLACLKGECEGE